MGYVGEVLADSPTSYWRLGEPSGTVADDLVGANDGTYVNTPTLGVTGALSGSSDTAVTFDAAQSEQVTLPVPTIGTNATIELWYKTGSTGRIFSLRHTTGAKIDIASTPRLVAEMTNDAGTSSGTFEDGFLDDNQWHHVALVKTGSGWELFVAGVSAATVTLAGTFTFTGAAIAVNPVGLASYFTGSVDEVAIYPAALTSTRIAAHFNAAGDPETPPTIAPPITVTRSAL